MGPFEKKKKRNKEIKRHVVLALKLALNGKHIDQLILILWYESSPISLIYMVVFVLILSFF